MAADIEPGTVLGRYRVRDRLGAGAMGDVYLAHDGRLNRPVALKVLGARAGADLARIEREARTASALNHPNILTVYDVDAHQGIPFISTEFIDGKTLRADLARGPLAVEESARIALAVADALSAAHAAGVVHRDVKPENVMVRADGWVKVLDFGIAEAVRPADATLTADHQDLLGTLGYLAPGLVRGGSASPATDVYALGVVLYEMLSGRRPFDDRAVGPYLVAVLNEGSAAACRVAPRRARRSVGSGVTDARPRSGAASAIDVVGGGRTAGAGARHPLARARTGCDACLTRRAAQPSGAALGAGGPAVSRASRAAPGPRRVAVVPGAPSAEVRTIGPPGLLA
jgi:serine/threonine protein kinase